MDRLTKHSKLVIDGAVPSENLGDLCLKMDFCDEFAFCKGCPVKKIMDRLCEYEDTGLTPEQIDKMKKSANINKCHWKDVLDVPKRRWLRILFQEVSEHGIIIDSVLYGIPELIHDYQGKTVKIRIVHNIANVFDIETGKKIVWFELFLPNGVNCKHSFYPYKTE